MLVPLCVVVYFWYDVWHTDHVNEQRRQDALASVLRGARADGASAARALGTRPGTDTAVLIQLIHRHTWAPVITFDRERRVFTATAFRTAVHDTESILLATGPQQVSRCVGFTYTRGADGTWTAKVSTRDDVVCRPSERIGLLAGQGRDRVTHLPAKALTGAGVRQALALPRQAYDVRDVVREGRTVTVDVLVRDTPRAAQCYRYVRTPDPGADQPRTTAVLLPAC
jgi:hypothetical protein